MNSTVLLRRLKIFITLLCRLSRISMLLKRFMMEDLEH